MDQSITLVGCGAMGGALLRKWLESPDFPYHEIQVITPRLDSVEEFLQDPRIQWKSFLSPNESVDGVVVFALKPQVLKKFIANYAPLIVERALIVSIAAGLGLKFYEEHFPKNPVIRVMPNTPARVGAGMTALLPGARVSRTQKDQAQNLFQTVGKTLWVESDTQIDAVTALSGCGPAYFFYLGEAMVQCAETLGLTKEQGQFLVRQTLVGSGAYLAQTDKPLEDLRREVTSPGGMTEAALNSLMENHAFAKMVQEALRSAMDRANQLKG